jgi:hypothetical protein
MLVTRAVTVWLWFPFRAWHFFSGCLVVDCGRCVVLEQLLCCTESRSVLGI